MTWRSSTAIPAPSAICERSDILCRYGLEQLAKQHYGEALASFSRAVRLRPDHALAWYYRGDALANLERYSDALLSFERSLSLDSDRYKTWTFQAVVLIHLERYQEALISSDRALELCPNDPEALMFRGAALQHLGQYKHAYASYHRAIAVQSLPRWYRRPWHQLTWQRCKQMLTTIFHRRHARQYRF